MTSRPAMPGVSRQALGVHSGDLVAPNHRSIDRSDSRMPHELTCTELVHFTDNEYLESIGTLGTDDPFCFQAKKFWTTDTESFNLTWWSPLPPDNWNDVIANNLEGSRDDYLKSSVGESRAFRGESLCGPLGFVTSWVRMLQQYAISRQSAEDQIEFRILGTFIYKKEIMYAVLVCIKGDIGVESFPPIPSGGTTEAFVRMSENFTWKVYSTIGFREDRSCYEGWTWDHLSFGFYFPTNDLKLQPQFCRLEKKIATTFKPLSRPGLNRWRNEIDRNASEDLVNRLERKIEEAVRRG